MALSDTRVLLCLLYASKERCVCFIRFRGVSGNLYVIIVRRKNMPRATRSYLELDSGMSLFAVLAVIIIAININCSAQNTDASNTPLSILPT